MPRIRSWLPLWLSTLWQSDVTSSEDLQLASTRCVLHRLLRICKAYDVVVDIWVSIPCTVGTRFGWINDTYKLVVAAIGLCRHVVRNGGGFCWEWTNDNEFWDFDWECWRLGEISSQSVTPHLVWSRPLLLDNNLPIVRSVCSMLRRH